MMRIAVLDDYQAVALAHPAWATLRDRAEIAAFSDHLASEEAIIARLGGFDAVCLMRERTPLSAKVLGRLPRLRLILCTGRRNQDSVDLAEAGRRGITVCWTEGRGKAAAEIAWAHILNLSRRILPEVQSLRAGGWQTSVGSGLEGRHLGIVGLGAYGARMAVIGRAFGMNVLAWSPNLTPERAAAHGAELVSRQALFAQSDVITIHMPLSVRSRGIVGAAEIGAMKPSAFLVNTSRAGLVDEAALIAALQAGRIAGYGADVFDPEPMAADHPFRSLPNVLATPHIGYVTAETYEVFFRQTVENILAFLDGSPVRSYGGTHDAAPLATATKGEPA